MPEYSVQRFRGGFAIVWWEGQATGDAKRRRRQLTATDRQSAEAEARRLWDGADQSPWTVSRIMTAYLAGIAEKPSYQRRQDAWKAMLPFWENVDPALVDERMCRSYRASRNVSDATARYELMQLSTSLNWAVDERKIEKRGKVWLPEKPEHKTRHISAADFNLFFSEIVAEHAKLYCLLGIYTMARPAAILDLEWSRVDFMRRLIDFTPEGRAKTAKRRTVVSINQTLLEALMEAYKARTSIYAVEHGGKQVASIKKAFLSASQRSGIKVTPYTLRHSGAVWAAEAGISMDELAQMMGHDDSATTSKHYARYSPGYLVRVSAAIEGAIKAA